jgi:hypothetical protein
MFRLLCFVALLAVAMAELTRYSNSTMLASKSDTTCVCTTVPCPVSGANRLVQGAGGADITYTYSMHAGHAVVTSAKGTITPASLDHGTGTTSCTQAYSRMLDDDGVKDCDAGHILAHHLGGYGEDPINIFPQDATVNRGAYAQFEGKIYDCTKSANLVNISWKFTYTSTEHTKPTHVQYDADFDAGECAKEGLHEKFTNGPDHH